MRPLATTTATLLLALTGCGPSYDLPALEAFFKPLVANLPEIAARVKAAHARVARLMPAGERGGGADVDAAARAKIAKLSPRPAMLRRRGDDGDDYNVEWISLHELHKPNEHRDALESRARKLMMSSNLAMSLAWVTPARGAVSAVSEGNDTYAFAARLRYAIAISYLPRRAGAPRGDGGKKGGEHAGRLACTLLTLPAGKLVATSVVAIPPRYGFSGTTRLVAERLGKRWGLRLLHYAASPPRRGLSKRAQTNLMVVGVVLGGIVLPICVLVWANRRMMAHWRGYAARFGLEVKAGKSLGLYRFPQAFGDPDGRRISLRSGGVGRGRSRTVGLVVEVALRGRFDAAALQARREQLAGSLDTTLGGALDEPFELDVDDDGAAKLRGRRVGGMMTSAGKRARVEAATEALLAAAAQLEGGSASP